MATVFIHAAMSLDGYIAGPRDDVDWSFRFGTDRMAEGVMQEIGAVVLGNRGFREGLMGEDTIPYGGMVKVPQFVVTHEPRPPLTVGALTFAFAGSIEQAVALAKQAAGDKRVAVLGASIGQQCLRAGLADEIMIHLVPILLGDGIRLFDDLGDVPIELERTEVVSTAQITSLRFRVRK